MRVYETDIPLNKASKYPCRICGEPSTFVFNVSNTTRSYCDAHTEVFLEFYEAVKRARHRRMYASQYSSLHWKELFPKKTKPPLGLKPGVEIEGFGHARRHKIKPRSTE